MQREPLEGFHRVTLEQVAAADREVHVRLAEKTRAGLVRDAAGNLPLDGPLDDVTQSSEVRWLLMPMPKRAPAKAPEQPKRPSEPDTKPAPKGQPKKTPKRPEQNQGPRKQRKGPMPCGAARWCAGERRRSANLLWLQLGNLQE